MQQTATTPQPQDVQGISGVILVQYLERIERLEGEKADIMDAIKEVFSEAKGNGFDVTIMRELLKLRKMDPNENEEHETMLDVYKQAVGIH
ncbi:MAG: DUF2312 domain-containing protein [Magnetococcales bacterium]|nr:DUF2312 domain-containing protein [Magnetococcales bacterium]